MKALSLSGNVGVMCALLQPPREVFELFDYVMIINEGRMSYFGPKEAAVPCMYLYSPNEILTLV